MFVCPYITPLSFAHFAIMHSFSCDCAHVCFPQQLLYTFDKQVCVSSCSLNKEETLLGEPLSCADNELSATTPASWTQIKFKCPCRESSFRSCNARTHKYKTRWCWLVPEEPPETLLWEICSNSVMWHANFAFSLLAVSLAQNARGEERLKPSNIPFLFYP